MNGEAKINLALMFLALILLALDFKYDWATKLGLKLKDWIDKRNGWK